MLVIVGAGMWVYLRQTNPADESLAALTLAAPIKLIIPSEGMYQIGDRDLKPFGLTIDQLARSEILLYDQHGPQPYWISGQGDNQRLYFYGRAVDSLYSNENYYWLANKESGQHTWLIPKDEALDTGSEPAGPVYPEIQLPDEAYAEDIFLEENLVYAVTVQAQEHWYWHSLTAPMRKEVQFDIRDIVAGPGAIELNLWGSSEAPGEQDHHLQVFLNDNLVADEFWDGRGDHQITADLPPGVLKEGENSVVLDAPGVPGVAADVILLDSIAVHYPRRFVAENDYLEFIHPGGTQRFEGFSGAVDIYTVDPVGQARRVRENFLPQSGFTAEAGSRILVVGSRGYHQPASIQTGWTAPDLRRGDLAAEYVVIGPADLLQAAEPLLALRRKEGLESMAIPLEAVYDQFNFGLAEPAAVRNLLEYARMNWQSPPRYLLLLGDASYDPRGFISDVDANRLPVFLVSTVYGGETGSDLGYAVSGGGDWPLSEEADVLSGIAVGRIPARDGRQVEQFVDKVIEFENSIANRAALPEWMTTITAVADGNDPQFQADAQQFLDLFNNPFTVDLLAPPAGQSGAGQSIRDKINAGSLLLAYFGHGSIQMWGKDQLFTKDDVALLANDSYPAIVLNLTCLTGLFTHPEFESLAESLLLRPAGGAVAVLAPTSLTLPNDQRFLSQAFARSLLADSPARLGDHFLAAQQAIPMGRESTRDVLRTFLLFGDPAMNLPDF
jgi:hypothetical protein